MKGVLTVQHQDDIFIPDIYGGHARIAVLFPGGWKKWWTPLGIDPSLSSFPISTNRRAPRDSKVCVAANSASILPPRSTPFTIGKTFTYRARRTFPFWAPLPNCVPTNSGLPINDEILPVAWKTQMWTPFLSAQKVYPQSCFIVLLIHTYFGLAAVLQQLP